MRKCHSLRVPMNPKVCRISYKRLMRFSLTNVPLLYFSRIHRMLANIFTGVVATSSCFFFQPGYSSNTSVFHFISLFSRFYLKRAPPRAQRKGRERRCEGLRGSLRRVEQDGHWVHSARLREERWPGGSHPEGPQLTCTCCVGEI